MLKLQYKLAGAWDSKLIHIISVIVRKKPVRFEQNDGRIFKVIRMSRGEESELSFLTPPPSLLLWWLCSSGRPLSSPLCTMLEPSEPAFSLQLHPHQRGWKSPLSLHRLSVSCVNEYCQMQPRSLCLYHSSLQLLFYPPWQDFFLNCMCVCVCVMSHVSRTCSTFEILLYKGQIVYYPVCVCTVGAVTPLLYICELIWHSLMWNVCLHCRDTDIWWMYQQYSRGWVNKYC